MENKLDRTMTNECFSCEHRRSIPGDCHIQCSNPDSKMTGAEWGINNGWFLYPYEFDPVWKKKFCTNFKAKEG